MTREDLKAMYQELASLGGDAAGVHKRRRGHQLESFLKSLLVADDLDPRTRYRPSGEEIDGSFVLDGRIFLLEAKWHTDPLPASTIYAFKGKVDGKLVGTVGVFVSMSGYSADAVNALTLGKEINVILCDKGDIEGSLDNENGFRKAILRKLRVAAEEGVIYLPAKTTQVSVEKRALLPDLLTAEYEVETSSIEDAVSVAIICEGALDVVILATFATRILKNERLEANVRLIPAMGKHALSRVADSVRALLPLGTPLIIVADSDGDVAGTVHMVAEHINEGVLDIIAVDPVIEAWLFPESDDPKRVLKQLSHGAPAEARVIAKDQAAAVPLDLLAKQPGFQKFYEALVKAVTLT